MNQPNRQPGHIVYLHPDGHDCLYADIPIGAPVVILGIVQGDGSILRHKTQCGIKQ